MNFKDQLSEKNKSCLKKLIKSFVGECNEDLEQEVYIKVWKNLSKYQEKGSVNAWVKTIAKNLCKDYLKSKHKKYEQCIVQDDEAVNLIKDSSSTPELKLIVNERQKRISESINGLKPKFREVVMLYEIDGLSYEEISKKLKCPVGTVKSRLYNAKRELGEKLKDLM